MPTSKRRKSTSQNKRKNKTTASSALPRKKKILITLAIIVGILLITCGGAFAYLYAQVPPLDTDNFNYIESSQILDKNGTYYQDLQGSELRDSVTIDQIPDHLENAFIAIEDQRFRTHSGIDIRRLGRAVLGVFTSGSLDGPGGSTITQQLIKLTHLTSERSVVRKFEEMVLSKRLEKVYTKDQILEAYLNKVNMSECWGVQAAARLYFAKDVSQLDIAQSAVLASIINLPSYYNPYVYVTDEEGNSTLALEADGRYRYNEKNRDRSLLVIEKMLELGYINQDAYTQAKAELEGNQIGLTNNPTVYNYSYFTDSVYEQVLADLVSEKGYTEAEAGDLLLNGGLMIYSTVDPNVQSAMEASASDDNLYPSQSSSAAAASAALTADTGEAVNFIPQVGMTVVDNATGTVAGIVGGRSEKTNLSLNRATQKFQPGSSTKPLTTYGPGLDSGAITLGTVFEDVPISYNNWRPNNSSGGFEGTTTIRNGLTSSTNTIAVQACVKTGLSTCMDYGKKLGLDIIESGDANDATPAALALGGYTHGQSTLAMAEAYATFPNQGTYTEPTFYTKVVNNKGETLLEKKQAKNPVFKPQTAYLVTDVLKDVVSGGTTNIGVSGQTIAGKTGTTDEERHAWFCGYSPYYSMAVWYGYDNNVVETSEGTYYLNIDVYGGSNPGPAYMFQDVMEKIHSNLESKDLPGDPGGIVTANIDKMSGKLATNLTAQDPRGSQAVTEMYIDGTQPTTSDDRHVLVDIDTSTNLLKSQFCPASLVSSVVRVQKPSNLFPEGITSADSSFVASGEASVLAPTQSCTTHTSEATASIGSAEETQQLTFTIGGNSNSGSITLKPGTTTTLAVSGPNNASTQFSVNGSSVTVGSNGNQATLTAVSEGTTVITVTQTQQTSRLEGTEMKTYETTYSRAMTVIVQN